MKSIQEQLYKKLDSVESEMRFYESRGDSESADDCLAQVRKLKTQIEFLSEIQRDGSGNLIHFLGDGTFELWSVRIPDGEKQIIEHYDCTMTFDNCEEMLEISKCLDVTEDFNIGELTPTVTENLKNRVYEDCYCLTSDYAFEMAVLDSSIVNI